MRNQITFFQLPPPCSESFAHSIQYIPSKCSRQPVRPQPMHCFVLLFQQYSQKPSPQSNSQFLRPISGVPHSTQSVIKNLSIFFGSFHKKAVAGITSLLRYNRSTMSFGDSVRLLCTTAIINFSNLGVAPPHPPARPPFRSGCLSNMGVSRTPAPTERKETPARLLLSSVVFIKPDSETKEPGFGGGMKNYLKVGGRNWPTLANRIAILSRRW